MNIKQLFMMLHSAVAVIAWGTMAVWSKQLQPSLLGGLISVGIVVLVTNRLGTSEVEKK